MQDQAQLQSTLPIDELKSNFLKNKYVVVRNFINKETIDLITEYLQIQQKHYYFKADGIAFQTKYADVVLESLLSMIRPRVEELTGKELYPSYSYMRIYRKNNRFNAHVDREACEYSASLTISYESEQLWPIYVMEGDKKVELMLDRGDVLLYKGCELVHGRDEFQGRAWTQAFLHYVDKNGPNAEYKFDKRAKLGPTQKNASKDQ